MDHLIKRRDAVQAVLDKTLGRPHKWSTSDCGRMSGLLLRKLGHALELPKVGAYSTPAGALRWLKKRGFDSLEARLDALGLPRIAPASALVGDILALQSTDALTALVIYLGQGRCLGFHEDSDVAVIIKPAAFIAAWSVLP